MYADGISECADPDQQSVLGLQVAQTYLFLLCRLEQFFLKNSVWFFKPRYIHLHRKVPE